MPESSSTRNDRGMSPTRPFVLDPPRPGVDRVDGILALDVDGVLNILADAVDRSTLPTVRGNNTRPLPIRMIDDKILDVLEEVVQCPGIRLGWLTTWGFAVAKLEPLLGGRLSGGFVVSERPSANFESAEWKLKAAQRLAQMYPSAALAWADDEAVTPLLQTGAKLHGFARSILVAPDPQVGLTIDEARSVSEFVIGTN
jgi:hypothetical protein